MRFIRTARRAASRPKSPSRTAARAICAPSSRSRRRNDLGACRTSSPKKSELIVRRIGEPILTADQITLAFGGITALNGISIEIRRHEILAIIGPNGAGKTSMLNVINGFYHPQAGTITWKGETRRHMRPYNAASQGIARTFQNVALFRGMTTLDNIMTGRLLRMHRSFLWQAVYFGPAEKEELAHR